MSTASVSQLISTAASNAGIDPSLAIAVGQQESGLNPSAVSKAGAIGVMQLMPGTAAGLGVNPYDTTQNIQGGVTYLSQQLNTFGNTAQALAAYNAGPGAVQSALNKAAAAGTPDAWLTYMPAETQNYVTNILGPDYSAPAPGSSILTADISAPLDETSPLDTNDLTAGLLTADIDGGAITASSGTTTALLIAGGAVLLLLLTR
jgi:hypothetical protein